MSNQQQMREILEVHRRHGVPLSMTVPFLLKLKGWAVGETAEAAGYTRAHLHFVLRRGIDPPSDLRRVVMQRLGVDPWSVYESSPD